ncbi:hypothetical protein Hanom_Chr13g01233511 [Helianthus anomalus]
MDLNSTEEANIEVRRSFSWDGAFFTSDGFLDAAELTSVIEGSGDEVNHQLQKIEGIESLEAKLFEEIEASTRASNPPCCPCGQWCWVPSSCGNFFNKMRKGKVNTAHCLRFPGDWYGLCRFLIILYVTKIINVLFSLIFHVVNIYYQCNLDSI